MGIEPRYIYRVDEHDTTRASSHDWLVYVWTSRSWCAVWLCNLKNLFMGIQTWNFHACIIVGKLSNYAVSLCENNYFQNHTMFLAWYFPMNNIVIYLIFIYLVYIEIMAFVRILVQLALVDIRFYGYLVFGYEESPGNNSMRSHYKLILTIFSSAVFCRYGQFYVIFQMKPRLEAKREMTL